MDKETLERGNNIQVEIKDLYAFDEALTNAQVRAGKIKIAIDFPNTSLDGREIKLTSELADIMHTYVTTQIETLQSEFESL